MFKNRFEILQPFFSVSLALWANGQVCSILNDRNNFACLHIILVNGS